jgi:hypothetical protein
MLMIVNFFQKYGQVEDMKIKKIKINSHLNIQ